MGSRRTRHGGLARIAEEGDQQALDRQLEVARWRLREHLDRRVGEVMESRGLSRSQARAVALTERWTIVLVNRADRALRAARHDARARHIIAR